MASLQAMKQSSLDLNLRTTKTRKQELLVQMDRVVPWAALIDVIAPYYPEGKNGRPPFALETMLRIHCMQQWFTLSDLAMEEAFFDTPIYREFAQLDAHGRLGPKAKKDAASSAPTTRPVSRVGAWAVCFLMCLALSRHAGTLVDDGWLLLGCACHCLFGRTSFSSCTRGSTDAAGRTVSRHTAVDG